jgi:hypothetical protein
MDEKVNFKGTIKEEAQSLNLIDINQEPTMLKSYTSLLKTGYK